jgi:hypothetical protein
LPDLPGGRSCSSTTPLVQNTFLRSIAARIGSSGRCSHRSTQITLKRAKRSL